jgi:hypothetical protein
MEQIQRIINQIAADLTDPNRRVAVVTKVKYLKAFKCFQHKNLYYATDPYQLAGAMLTDIYIYRADLSKEQVDYLQCCIRFVRESIVDEGSMHIYF